MQLIIGTGGLAKQALVDLKNKNKSTLDDLVFFDNTESVKGLTNSAASGVNTTCTWAPAFTIKRTNAQHL